jgi:hypothetical protein
MVTNAVSQFPATLANYVPDVSSRSLVV